MRISETFKSLPAIKARQAIPAHRRKSQWVKTITGGAVFCLGLLAPWKLGFPWQAGVGISAFGAFTASQQLVTDFLKAALQLVPAVLGAIGGKKD